MKKLLLFILCLSFAGSAAGQIDRTYEKDSLRQVIEQTTGKEKLMGYQRLTNLYHYESTEPYKMDTLLALYDEFYHEALKQEHKIAQGLIKANILLAFMDNQRYDDIIARAPGYIDKMAELEVWEFYYSCYETLIKTYLYKGDPTTALLEAQTLYDLSNKRKSDIGMGMALYSMAEIYLHQGRFEEQVDCLRQSIERLDGNESLMSTVTLAWFDLCEALMTLKRYDEMPEAYQEYEEANKRYIAITGVTEAGASGNLWSSYARYYFETGDYDRAEAYCNKVDSIVSSLRNQTQTVILRAAILNHRGQYEEALVMINQAEESGDYYTEEALSVRSIKRDILANLGRYEEAFALSEKLAALSDSIRRVEYAYQADALRTQYEVDRHITDKERKHIQLTWAVIVCLLLLTLLVVYFLYSQRLRVKNIALYKQIQENLKATVAPADPPTGNGGNGQDAKLFLRISDVLEKEKLYQQPILDRRTLADHLGTNEKYISKAIREGGYDSLSTYLSAVRLQHALHLLNEQPDMSLETVATQSGHKHYTSFYRTFSKQYGITPSEYKKIQKSTKSP